MVSRRSILLGLLAAPAIIRTPGLLMPVRPVDWYERQAVTFGPPPYLFGPEHRIDFTDISALQLYCLSYLEPGLICVNHAPAAPTLAS